MRSRLAVAVASITLAAVSVSTAPIGAQQQQGGGLPELETRVGVVENNVSDLNTTTLDQAEDLTTLATRVLALETSVTQLQNQVNTLQADMTAVKDQVAALAADVADLKAKVASLEGAVTGLQADLAALQALAEELQGRLDALNTLSGLSSGVKRLLSWVQLPTQTYFLSQWLFELELTCPVGVPLHAMLARTPVIIESMVPALNVDLANEVSAPTPLDIAAPAGMNVTFKVDFGLTPAPGVFPVIPFVLCLNVDGLTAMASDLSAPIVP